MKSIQYLSITGMTCQNCVQQVKSNLEKSGHHVDSITLDPPIAAISIEDGPDNAFDSKAVAEMNRTLPAKYQLTAIDQPPDIRSESMVQISSPKDAKETEKKGSRIEDYWPLLLVLIFICTGTLIAGVRAENATFEFCMSIFMGLFFVVFSFFKFLDLKGFATAYRSYDWGAKILPAYGFVYPFLELFLGIGYLLMFEPLITNSATVLLMTFSIGGVIQAVVQKNQIQCACLGTGFNLPMSKVTIIEDGTMILMAATMLVLQFTSG